MQTTIRTFIILVSFLACSLSLQFCGSGDKGPRVLIFNKSEFYVHACMPAAVEALQKICRDNNWQVDVTDDAEVFTEKKLRRYAAIVFLNTAGDVLNPTQQVEFERYIQAGGGYAGIHTAIDTEHNWKWYGRLVGGRFDGNMEEQNATILVLDRQNAATQHLDSIWQRHDEWFNLKDLSPNLNVLLSLDEKTCAGGQMGNFHPLAWYHDFDGGRAFFTALGHPTEAYSDPAFLQHLTGGLKYAVGNNNPLVFKERRAPAPQNTTGFVKTSLVCDLYEPMQMKMLPNGKILFIERRGAIKLFDPASNNVTVTGELKVFLQNEEGLLGLAIDPEWEQNHWIYLYYSPEKSENTAIKLARFVFDGARLDLASEQVLLEIPTDRSVHNYHAAGALEFDAQGYLYLATGDNTDHYGDGYTSIDERPGKSQYDSQKSAANSMDLRGKILKIKPLPDGSYICPADNLFTGKEVVVTPGAQLLMDDPIWAEIINPAASGGPNVSISRSFTAGNRNTLAGKGRPEIFVMGCRNPFRFSIDNRRHLLLWGEPGPDAGVSDDTRGPEGYDEVNITRTAGFYGWPYVVANNKPYRDFNFETQKPGAWFDPQHLINDSPNNTGMKDLPPARPPLIWYPFKSSAEFPLVANGTRCAMGGPVYYCDQYPAETRFPDNFDGKFIIYEWMRNWLLAVGLDSLDQLTDIQPLAESATFARPIDMFIDKNGSLWVLEYGTEWYSSNPDACLSRVDYIRGNGAGTQAAQAGGNTAPSVSWDFAGKNRSFYLPDDQIQYKVAVSDPEDGSLADGRIAADSIRMVIGYHDQAVQTARNMGKLPGASSPFARGKALVDGSDCKACHAIDRQVNGPAYLAIAARYEKDKTAVPKLTQKIVKGGFGAWGDRVMSAHPQVPEKDVIQMVRWVLSLNDPANRPLPIQGLYTLTPPATGRQKSGAAGSFVFYASYKDRGLAGQPALSGSQTLVLRPAMQQAEGADSTSKGLRTARRPLNGANALLYELKNQDFLMFRQVDLHGITTVSFALDLSQQRKYSGGGRIELHLDKPDGRVAGTVNIPAANGGAGLSEAVLQVDRAAWPSDGALHDIYFVVTGAPDPAKPVAGVDWLRFGF